MALPPILAFIFPINKRLKTLSLRQPKLPQFFEQANQSHLFNLSDVHLLTLVQLVNNAFYFFLLSR
jgi:hypothetical protein